MNNTKTLKIEDLFTICPLFIDFGVQVFAVFEILRQVQSCSIHVPTQSTQRHHKSIEGN